MSIRLAFAPFLMAGLLAGPVFAQTTAPTGASGPAATQTRRDVMVERRIAELQTKLKITPAEQKSFDGFAQAMRDNTHSMDEAMAKRQASLATASAVDQMKAYADMTKAHAEDVARLVVPFDTLYAALSPDQKKLADQSFREFSMGPRAARNVRG